MHTWQKKKNMQELSKVSFQKCIKFDALGFGHFKSAFACALSLITSCVRIAMIPYCFRRNRDSMNVVI